MTREQALAEIEVLKPIEAQKWQIVSKLIDDKLTISEVHQEASNDWMQVSKKLTQLLTFIDLLDK